MKILRRIVLSVLFAFFGLVCVCDPLNVFAEENSFSNGYATYRVKEVADSKELGYGVYYHRDISTLATDRSGYTNSITVGHEYGQQVNVLEIDTKQDAKLVPYAYLDGSQWVATTVKKAAAQYELKNPGWKVVAAVNGDYFKINNDMKASTGVTIGQGEYYKSVSDHGPINTVAIKNDGEGKQLFNANIAQSYPVLSIYDEKGTVIKKFDIAKVNEEPGNNEIALYYPTRIKSYENGVSNVDVNNAWFVKLGEYSVTTVQGSFYGKGIINSFLNETTTLLNGQFAVKSNNPEVTDMLAEGVQIRCQYEYKDPSVEGIENFIGYPFPIMTEKVVHDEMDKYRHPRTILGQKADGTVVLAVVDGRQNVKDMYGASTVEMAAVMGYYGCVDAWNLDGGGSSTLIVRKQYGWEFGNAFKDDANSQWYVTNSPSDGNERSDGNHLLVVVKTPEMNFDIDELTETSIQLHVALLTDIEKYSNLYVLVNDKFYPVENELVKITGLKKNTVYQFYLYAKDGDNYIDLMTNMKVSTNKSTPTDSSVSVTLFERNGVEQILVRFRIDKPEAVNKVFLVGDQRYLTTSSTILIDKTTEFYNSLKGAKIEIHYQINDALEEEVLELTEYDIDFSCDYVVDELYFTVKEIFKDIFE